MPLEESIRNMVRAFPEMLIGAGTVTNRTQAERAVCRQAPHSSSPRASAGPSLNLRWIMQSLFSQGHALQAKS